MQPDLSPCVLAQHGTKKIEEKILQPIDKDPHCVIIFSRQHETIQPSREVIMEYTDIIIEASEYGVIVEDSRFGTIRFHYGSLNNDAIAWMSHSMGKTWIAHNCRGTCFRGSKAEAADWCLDQSANGPT